MATMTMKKGICGVIGCETCKLRRIAHWFCSQCGGGPYKFDKSDPGPYKVMRSAFDRTMQQVTTNAEGVTKFEFITRRVCSSGCWQRETRRVANDEMELAQRRPDLAPAIQKKLEAEQDAQVDEFNDDLGVSAHPGSF